MKQSLRILFACSSMTLLAGCHTFQGAKEDWQSWTGEYNSPPRKAVYMETNTAVMEPDQAEMNTETTHPIIKPGTTTRPNAPDENVPKSNVIPVISQPTNVSQPPAPIPPSNSEPQNKMDEPVVRSTPNPE